MRIGIDLGGTKIEGLVLGPGGEELARGRIETPQGNQQGDYEATLAAIAGLVGKLARDSGASGDVPQDRRLTGNNQPGPGVCHCSPGRSREPHPN